VSQLWDTINKFIRVCSVNWKGDWGKGNVLTPKVLRNIGVWGKKKWMGDTEGQSRDKKGQD